MAENKNADQSAPPIESDVYCISPGATASRVEALIDIKLAHLTAMLMTTYGECGESFRGYNDTIQDNFMWSCSCLASEIKELFDAMGALQRTRR